MLRPKILDTLKDYSHDKFFRDALAGLVVGIFSLPLAIAFSIASGVGPERGIITAVIAGFIVSFLGGSRTQIGGPTGAFVIIIYSIVQNYGINGLLIATVMAGIFLILLGIFKAGTLIKFIPHSVIVGFTSGIALIIFSSQISDALGLEIGSLPSDFIEKMSVIFSNISHFNVYSLAIAAGTILLMTLWPKRLKVPGSIVAIFIFSFLAFTLSLPVETIGSRFGELSMSLSFISFHSIDLSIIRKLISPAFTIAILAAIESLLSAVVADGMIGSKHRPNTELVAQGAANIAAPLFGGIPATGALARTAINIKNGGRTPIAGIVNSFVILITMLFLGNYVKHIPMACLAGILMVVAYNMSEWRSFLSMIKMSKSSLTVVLATFFFTVFVDLTFAIEMGLILASLMFIGKMTMYTNISKIDIEDDIAGESEDLEALPEGILAYEVNGPLFFGAAYKLKEEMESISSDAEVIIVKMGNVPMIDSSGIHLLEDIVKEMKAEKIEMLISGMQPQILEMLERSGLDQKIGRDKLFDRFDQALTAAKENILKK